MAINPSTRTRNFTVEHRAPCNPLWNSRSLAAAQVTMTMVAALTVGRLTQQRLQKALRGIAGVRFCDSCNALANMVGTVAVDIVLTELYDRHGTPVFPTIRLLHTRFPSLRVLGYAAPSAQTMRDVVTATTAGMHGVVVRGTDDGGSEWRRILDDARTQSTGAQISGATVPLVPPVLGPLFSYCATHGGRPFSVTELASALHVNRKTLSARLRSAALPDTRHVIAWHRLLYAARLLEDPGRRVESIVAQLNFPSAAALTNQTLRYLRVCPSQLRRDHPFAFTLSAFTRAIASNASEPQESAGLTGRSGIPFVTPA